MIGEESVSEGASAIPASPFQDNDLHTDVLKALTVINADKKASARHLQRVLKLSYGRAVEIMAHLEEERIIGPSQGNQPRAIHFDKLQKVWNKATISSALPSDSPEALRVPPTDDVSTSPIQDRPPETLIQSADALSESRGSSISNPVEVGHVPPDGIGRATVIPHAGNPIDAGSSPAIESNLEAGWRNADATQKERSETSTTAETKRVAPDAIAAVEKGSQSLAGSSPAPATNPSGDSLQSPPGTVEETQLNPSALSPDGARVVAGEIPAVATNPTMKELSEEFDTLVSTGFEFKKAHEELRLCVISYLPGDNARFNTLAFLENLKRNPPAHELITFSDTPDFGDYGKPTVLIKRSIELPSLMEKPHGVANLAFYLAFGEAWKRNYTHFLYLESDIRVRSKPDKNFAAHVAVPWDKVLWYEFLWAGLDNATDHGISPKSSILGGSMMLDNPFGSDSETAQRARELLAKWNPNLNSQDPKERNKPIVCRAKHGVEGSMVGCNGAGAIYSVEGLRALYAELSDPNDNQTKVGLAAGVGSFDFDIGKRIWRMHGAGAFDRVAHLPSQFSSFGDSVSTESERLEMLRSGSVVLCHPIKSAEVGA